MNVRTSQEERPARNNNYRLRIQPVRLGPLGNYQVRIGMDGDTALDYVPVHRSAFSQKFQVEIAHSDREPAELEALMLAELLDCQLLA